MTQKHHLFALLGAIGIIVSFASALSGCKRNSKAETRTDAPAMDPVTVEMALATVGPIETTIRAQGPLAPGQGSSAKVSPLVSGRLVEVCVREGQHVAVGEVIALIDNRVPQAQVGSALAALKAAEAQARGSHLGAQALAADNANAVAGARLALNTARLDLNTAVQQTAIAMQAAETDLQKTLAGARPQEIAQADQVINQTQATQSRSETELARVRFLFEKGISPKRQLDDAQTALAVSNSALESAKQQASLLRAGARAEDLHSAELRVQQAREAARQAKASGEAKVLQANAALRAAEQSVLQVAAKQQEAQAMRDTTAQKKADLTAAQATAKSAELRAPLSGIVTRRALNPGDMADPTTPVIEITETRSLDVLANLAAEDGMKIRVGIPARVMAPEAPGQTFQGQVLSVGQVDPLTNLLTVRITVSNPRAVLKVGTFATADIILESNPLAVTVPKQALLTREGKSILFVVGADNVARARPIIAGTERNGRLEIRHGLQPGERVIQLGQYALTDGAAVRAAAPITVTPAEAAKGGAK